MADPAPHITPPAGDTSTDALIAALGRDLRPVTRVSHPLTRTALWLAAVLWTGGIFALFANLPELAQRLMATPDMILAFTGAALTAILAAFAAFQTTMPDRTPYWGLLPLPSLALWISASSWGCLRQTPAPLTTPMPPSHSMECLGFLLTTSLPLAAVMLALMLRGLVLRPGLTTSLAGLASAGAGAVLLTLIHPFDATASDLLMHLAAVIAIIVTLRLVGPRALGRSPR